jgi:predicted ATPase
MPSVALGTDAGASAVLLERGAELSRLADRLEAVGRGGGGHVLLVGGEAGVGKTTLVRRFCEEHGRPARILWGACDPLFTPSPLGPLLAVAEGTGGELRAVVERGAMPYQVVAALARELSARPPTIFVLEDVHWADEATLDVLRLLARRVETVPALVVAHLPRRRAGPRAPAADPARRAGDRPHRGADAARPALAGSGHPAR